MSMHVATLSLCQMIIRGVHVVLEVHCCFTLGVCHSVFPFHASTDNEAPTLDFPQLLQLFQQLLPGECHGYLARKTKAPSSFCFFCV